MTSDDSHSRAPQRTGPPVRSTILLTVLVLSAIALATAGFTAAVLQDRRVTERVDSDLSSSVESFRLLAETGVNPSTGEPFASAAELVRAAIARTIPARNEGLIGIVDGRVEYVSTATSVALADDPAFVAAIGPILADPNPTISTIRTDLTTYRAAVVPVVIDGADVTTALVLAFDLTAELGEFRQVFTTYILVAVASLAVVGLVGWLVAGRLLRPIRILAESARRIGRDDLSERIPVTGSDDLARMTSTVNEMLDRLEQSFATQRELVGDVSHELRTPLTVARGHLELMDPDDAADVRSVQALVLDEVARMNRVVDDLTTLASVEQPGFYHPKPLEAGLLTDETYDKALALGAREWVIESRAEAAVLGDRQRLTQAWLQLAANAVKFSGEGSRIALGSAVRSGELHLWVTDAGVGIAVGDIPRIFERFHRVGELSTRGSGLGLAIVQAIMEAHGGRVGVVSDVGRGSTFTLIIPGAAAHEQEVL